MLPDSKTLSPGMEAAALTDVGRQRSNNEDSYLLWVAPSGDEFLRKGRLAVVADGMGGYEGGQEASRLAVETVRQVYDRDSSGDAQQALVAGLVAAHDSIQRYAVEHPELQGMGTTCTAACIIGNELRFAHVGDSRLYLIHGGSISRLTRDDSYVGRLVESGMVRAEDAESHPQRHILTAALGSGHEITPNTSGQPITLTDGDILLLCTDGLWSVVAEAEISRLAQSYPPAEACSQLISAALERGGPDNITVIILRIPSQ
jgi:protein phosphatase